MKHPQDWRRAAVYGLGLSGLAAATLLRSRGVAVDAYDERELEELRLGDSLENDPEASIFSGAVPDRLERGVDALVVSPGVPLTRPLVEAARESGVEVVAEVELAYSFLEGPVVGVTGSNGKSTTTAWIGELLRAAGRDVAVCGNIGEPLSSVVDGVSGRVFVVELSSFQLETVDEFRPRAAALLNLEPDHLDRHVDFASYAAAKGRIFARQALGDVAVINADDEDCLELAPKPPVRLRTFSARGPVDDGCFVCDDSVYLAEEGEARELFRLGDVPLPGPHHVENAMAAALVVEAIGVQFDQARPGLKSFSGLPHRTELVAEIDGVRYFNDSKATNVAATLRALEGFADASVHLILGGQGKGADFAELREVVSRKAARVYLIGESAVEIRTALGEGVAQTSSLELEKAVSEGRRRAKSGEVVLLSPACASFDQFRNFSHRGDVFRESVRRVQEVPLG